MAHKPRPPDKPGAEARVAPGVEDAPATPSTPHKPETGAPDEREPDPNNPDAGGGRDPR